MSEPLGKSQVLEYIRNLSKNYSMSLYSFEKDLSDDILSELSQDMKRESIDWYYQEYSNKYGLVSTLSQIISSYQEIKKIIKTKDIEIIHARSLIPTVIALMLKRKYKVKVIADIRGFQIDEKAEVGRVKKDSLLYKMLKKIEQYTYKKSDVIVSLTHAAINYIGQFTDKDKIVVIPTCANREVFKMINEEEKEAFKQSLGYQKTNKIIIHAGAVSNWYDFDSELLLMQNLMQKEKDIHFLILNKGEHAFVSEKLNQYDIDRSRVKVTEVNFYEMYKYLNIADASLFIIKPTFSKTASAPTKFAENLACGLYSITNDGIGDMDTFFVEHSEVGYSFPINEIKNSVDTISNTILMKLGKEENVSDAYIKLYDRYLSKEMAVKKYSAIYDMLVKGRIDR